MKKLIPIIALFLIVSASYAQSQIPPPSGGDSIHEPVRTTEQQKKKTNTDNPTTENFSATVKILKAPVIQIEAAKKPEEKNWYSSPEWWMVIFSFLLATITVALALYTAKLYRATVNLGRDARETANNQSADMAKSISVAKQSADAAQKSADALPIAERAYVFVNVEDNQISDNITHRMITTPIFIHNHGKTPAVITNVCAVLALDQPQMPAIMEITFPIGMVLGNDKWYRYYTDRKVSKIEFDNLKNGNATLFCCGFINYKDVFNTEHTTRFCWEYKPHKSRPATPWISTNNKEGNYYT